MTDLEKAVKGGMEVAFEQGYYAGWRNALDGGYVLDKDSWSYKGAVKRFMEAIGYPE